MLTTQNYSALRLSDPGGPAADVRRLEDWNYWTTLKSRARRRSRKSFTDVIPSAALLAAAPVYFPSAPSYLSELLALSDPLVGPLC